MPGWNVDNAAGSAGTGAVTLLDGSSFCISAANGDMFANMPHGAFFHDTRFVSEWNLTVNGSPIEALAAKAPEPFRAVFIGRATRRDGHADSPLLIERERVLGAVLAETITVRNYSRTPVACEVVLSVDADFADLFAVKDGRKAPRGKQTCCLDAGRLVLESEWEGRRCGLVVASTDAPVEGRRFVFRATVAAHGRWSRTVSATPLLDGRAPAPAGGKGAAGLEERRLLSWRTSMPIADLDDDAVQKVIVRSQEDLGALRMFHPDHPERTVVAAGAPWFMALFGRDSLLASFMSLLLDPSLALGTLRTLADYQGKDVNPLTEEEPGRILHEVRLGAAPGLAFGGRGIYYGTADATALFVVVLGELSRWGLEADAVRALLPAADRALAWIQDYGDRDGDGFVEYARHHGQGLRNQGWKDSWDGINFADGTLAEPPIALCEVQGYSYAAYLGRALIALTQGDGKTARLWTERAARLKEAFNDRFWLPERGYFALALDRDKEPVDSLASNMGHCLWSGIVDQDKAAQVAERLTSPEMFTGWGIRTLASTMGAYNPASYHNGSVWPHDSALAAAGLMRYGFVEEAQRIAYGLFEAADYFGGRLPELFCGLDRASYPEPVPYPASCSPQAWASAAPIQLIRTLMRFDPGLPWKELWLAPALPEGFGEFRVDNVPFAENARLSIDIAPDGVRVAGLPPGVTLRLEARPQLLDLLNLSSMGRPPAGP